MTRLLLLAALLAGVLCSEAAPAPPPCIVSGPFIRYYSSGSGTWRGSVLLVTPPLATPLQMSYQQGASPVNTVTGSRLYELALSPTRKIEVWRVKLVLEQADVTVPVQYWFPKVSKCKRFPTLGNKFTFFLAGRAEFFHWSFYSCHNEGDDVQPGYFKQYPKGANSTWGHLLARHADQPFHLLAGLGDQIYNDNVLQVPALAKVWKQPKDPKDRLAAWRSIKWTPVVQKQVTDFYVHSYITKWAHPVMSIALASIPTTNMWDDHEVFDGANNQDPAVTALPIYNQIVRAGLIFFRLFQLHSTSLSPSGEVFFKPGFTQLKRLGPSAALLQLDTRTERTRKQFVSTASYNIIMAQLAKLPDTTQFLFVATGDPVVAPSIAKPLGALEAFATVGSDAAVFSEWGDSSGLDDAMDLWSWPTRHDERSYIIKRMQAFAKAKSVRVIFLGGDVHSTGMGDLRSTRPFVKDASDYRYMPGFTASAIGVAPMPSQVCQLMNIVGAIPTLVLDGSTSLIISPTFKDDRIKGRCNGGNFWINHRNYGEVMPVDNKGQVRVNIYYEADNKGTDEPFRSFGSTIPKLST